MTQAAAPTAVVAETGAARRAPGRRRSSPVPVLAGPGVLFVTACLLLPLCMMMRYSLNRFVPGELMVEAVTLSNYAKFFRDSYYQDVLWTTVWVSAVSTAICAVAGFPVAYYLARTAGKRTKALLMLAVVLPLLMGNAVRTAAWMVVLGQRGVVSSIVSALGITDKLELLYTPTAVIIGLVSVLLPFMIITVQSVLEDADRSVTEAAASLGAAPLVVMRRVVLPLAMPGLLAGTVLCFILSMNAYATPVLIGGPKVHMMAPAVYDQMSKAMNWPFGAALAFILMAVTLVLTVVSNVLVQRRFRKWIG